MVASAAVLVVASGTASAVFHHGPDLSSGDDRATAHQIHGNVDCGRAGLAGSTVDAVGFVDDGRMHLTVTAMSGGNSLTGLVVESGLTYNVYPVARLGAMPYLGLHTPLFHGDDPAPIRYWFACGVAAPSAATAGAKAPGGTPTATVTVGGSPTPGQESATDPTSTAPGSEPGTGPADDGQDGQHADPGTDPDGSPGTDQGTDRENPADGGTATALPDTGPVGSAGSEAAVATPGVLAGPTPSADYTAHLRNVAEVGLGDSVYLAVALLLVVTGGLLVVAPRHLALIAARLRQRG